VRNHEGYPSQFTGDVDVYAELEQVRQVVPGILSAAASTGWSLLRTVDRPWVVVLQFVRHGAGPERSVMVIEFFDRFTWLCFPYAGFEEIWAGRTTSRDLPVVDPSLGMMITVGHYLFWAGFLPQKYQSQVRQIVSYPTCIETLSTVFGAVLAQRIHEWLVRYCEIQEDGWETRPNIPEQIMGAPWSLVLGARLRIIAGEFKRSPAGALKALLNIAGVKLKEFVVVRGDVLFVDDAAWDILKEVKRFHLYKNRNSIVLDLAGSRAARMPIDIYRAYWAISRGGLCIVSPAKTEGLRVRLMALIFGRHARRLVGPAVRGPHLIDSVIEALK